MRSGEDQYQGITPHHVEVPTRDIPAECRNLCTWVVVRPGAGGKSVSRLKYPSGLCVVKHESLVSAPIPQGLSGLPGAGGSEEGARRWVSL